jgi:hypothetical protein
VPVHPHVEQVASRLDPEEELVSLGVEDGEIDAADALRISFERPVVAAVRARVEGRRVANRLIKEPQAGQTRVGGIRRLVEPRRDIGRRKPRVPDADLFDQPREVAVARVRLCGRTKQQRPRARDGVRPDRRLTSPMKGSQIETSERAGW